MKILYSKELAERLNVSVGTLHKKEFQRRIGLPPDRIGRRIAIPEPKFEEWVLNPNSEKGHE